MTRSLESIKINHSVSATVKNQMTADTTKVATGQLSLTHAPAMANGVSANQASRAFQFKGTITSAGTLVIDLYDGGSLDYGAGAGKDILGQDILMLEIVDILIVNHNAVGDAGQLEVEPDATNGWAPIGSHTVANGGALRGQGAIHKTQPSTDGFPVTDASSHRLLLTATGGAVDYEIIALARHDVDESSSSSSSSSSESSSSSASSVSSSSSESSSSQSSSLSSSSLSSLSSSSVSSVSSLSSSSASSVSSSSASSLSSSSASSVSSQSLSTSSSASSASSSSSSHSSSSQPA